MLSEPLVKLNSVYVKVQEALLHLRGDLLVGDTGVVGKAVGGTARIFDAPAFYAQQVRQILRKFGADAHMFVPGPGVPILGPELVTNGDFGNGLTGWQVGAGATIANVSGALQITNTSTNGWATNQANIAVAVGKTYQYSVTNKGSTQITFYIRDGVGSNPDMVGITVNTGEAKAGTFVSNTTGLNFRVFCIGAAGLVTSVDDISVKEILGYTNYLNGFAAGNYLESTGNTNAAVDGAVGLVLDAAGSVGPELLPNTGGPFTSTTGWTARNANLAIVGGEIQVTATAGAYPGFERTITGLTPGKTYRLSGSFRRGTCVSNAALAVSGIASSEVLNSTTNPNQVSCVFTATATSHSIGPYISSGTVGVGETFFCGSVSVREVTGTHATQATTANKPILRRGIVNLLTYSNDLTNAAWPRTGTPVVTGGQADHLGGTTAFQFSRTTTGASYLAQTYTKSASALQYTLAVVMKAGTSRYSSLRTQGSYPSRVDAIFDMQTGVVNSVATAGSFSGSAASITSIGNGYYLCTVSATTDANGGLSVHTSFNSTAMPIDGSDVVSSGTGYYSGFGLFQGTLTAQQIIAAGGIPLTTTAPASSQYGIGEPVLGPELVTADFTIPAGGTALMSSASIAVGDKLQIIAPSLAGVYAYDQQAGGWTPIGNKTVIAANGGFENFYNSTGSPVTLTTSQFSVREITGYKSLPNSYAWQFDGSNDVLALTGPLFQMADDHCIVAGASKLSVDSSSPGVFAVEGSSTDLIGLTFSASKAQYFLNASGTAAYRVSTAGYQSTSIVMTGRKIGTSAALRVNGVQQGTALSTAAVGSSSMTSATIGRQAYAGVPAPFNGLIYPIIAIKGTVSDAELRVLEKWLGSIAGVAVA